MKLRLKNRLFILISEQERNLGRRITNAEIAEAVGVSSHTIGSWVRNDVTKFEAPILERLGEYFHCEVADLLYFERVEGETPSESVE